MIYPGLLLGILRKTGGRGMFVEVSNIKKMNTQELLQNMVYDIDQIRGYVRFMALLVLFQLCLGIIIGIWIGTQLAAI